MISWTHITRFGDVTITMLAAFAIAAWLYMEDERRLALWWSGLFAAGLGIVVATKMAFIGWGIGIRSLDFTGFGGHAMRATAVIPVLFYLMLQKAPFPLRLAGVLAGFAAAALIALSRVVLHAHSVSESVAGVVLGAAVSIAFIRVAGGSLRKEVFNPLRIALAVLALLPAPYLQPAPTQEWLTDVSLFFSGRDKPYMRTACKLPAAGSARAELRSCS